MSENSDKYRRAIDGFSAVVEAVPDEKWSAVSPCDGWTARDIVVHVAGGIGRIYGAGNIGEHADATPKDDEDAVASYVAARDAALKALTEDNLAKVVQGPMGEMPLDQVIGMFIVPDVLIHSWDLAQCAGNPVSLDEDLVSETYERLLPLDAMIRETGVFGRKVDPPADADLQTKLMCFTGRRV